MDKLILIDGNSLLNRAFYAMNVFTTGDGLPTNGIFGFVKLLFKIIDDENPKYLAVAFDVHAPTFRHKMYGDYKGTRKPMPEELVRQVPVLKELLTAMKIRIVELAGYEADDIIGTLSRKFSGVHSLIYTGDRDSYQLVNEHVDVCFTKRGVSDLDRLTAANFVEKVGLAPAQIIDEKALMGDSSDNIPGVRGVGPKSALSLLHRYGNLDGVYAALGEIYGTLHAKLEEGRESAYLSRTLATIDVNVPIDVALDDCILRLPFPEAARTFFGRLEFRSLMDGSYFPKERAASEEVICTEDPSSLLGSVRAESEFFFCREQEGFYLGFGGKQYLIRIRENFLQPGVFLHELVPLFTEIFAAGKRVIVPDVKATLGMLDELGIAPACVMEDVSILRYLGDSNLRPASAKELAMHYSLHEMNCAEALSMAYAEALKKTEGTAEASLYRELELPLAYLLYDMEKFGVCVDIAKFPEFSERYRKELASLTERIYAIAGETFNLNSPFKLSEVLFGKLGLDPKGAKRNQRGGYSTGAEVLEKLADEHEIARLILRFREIQKLQTSYIDGILPLAKNGVVHTTYNQTATTTGRLSSANPNLQNIPVRTDAGRELRKLFVAREGNVLVDADYSQIELRLLTHFSGCKALVDAYCAGEDIHTATAARVFGVKLSDVTAAQRRRAKTVNFGILYGMSAFGLSRDLGCSAQEAAEIIRKYFLEYPEVKTYMEENVERAKREGFVTTVLGRRRYIPEIRSSNYNVRSFGERAAMNMPLQGSSADIIKIAMLRVAERLRREGLRSRLVLQVHDELLLDTPEEETERASAVLKEEMEGAIALRVPLIAEVSVGRSWYDAK